jgi:predicted permease
MNKLSLTVCTCACTILLGLAVARLEVLSAPARKGISALYASVVFPLVVFRGVAALELSGVEPRALLLMLLAKLCVAACGVVLGRITLHTTLGSRAALAHGAAFAMAASHSFDVTFGVPLASLLYPRETPYIFLNQSVQLVLVNPILLAMMELQHPGEAAEALLTRTRRVIFKVARQPLVLMTALGLLASVYLEGGLVAYPLFNAFTKQGADAGAFLGFLSLGFAMADLHATSPREIRQSLIMAALKLLLMPALYSILAVALRVKLSRDFLRFAGTLPASASVYSLAVSRDLSPQALGPLVPASLLLSLVLVLAPVEMANGVRALLAIAGISAAQGLWKGVTAQQTR